MLVAKESFDYQYLPAENEEIGPRVRRVRRVRTKTKVIYSAILLLTMVLSFILTAKQAQIASAGYDILTLKKQLEDLKAENQSLQVKLEELKSLDRIEYVATTKLGMQKPELAEGVQFVPVEYSKAGSKSQVEVASAEKTPKKPQKEQKQRNSVVQALANLING